MILRSPRQLHAVVAEPRIGWSEERRTGVSRDLDSLLLALSLASLPKFIDAPAREFLTALTKIVREHSAELGNWR